MFSCDPTCRTKHCDRDHKCVMVQPRNCVGCDLIPRCYHRYCDTSCRMHCRPQGHHLYTGCLLMVNRVCPARICGWADGPPVEEPPP
ncbi:hypothetical protein OESDEN_08378 [Oesophagostomum dentatum]|uniref:Uncharacterized protein n=1 Tax=Oesophagostomum dentatum TaxID=61180 RepID=A0A0B1T6J1_OESDE|nr:hypothetical protein OESDEN_08378 [Oesophagostomum dentatum]